MALINCRECGKEISDSAKQCPHCGCSTKFGNEVAQAKGLLIAMVVACIASLIGASLFFFNLEPLFEGLDDYNGLGRWLSRDDEAWGIFMRVCIGLGMLVGSVITFMKINTASTWQARRTTIQNPTTRIPDELLADMKEDASFSVKREQGTTTGWKCSCGRLNANYISTCVCGKNKREV